MGKTKKKWRVLVKRFTVGMTVLLLGAGSFFAWRWVAETPCKRIEVAGAIHAQSEEILALAHVDTGAVLFDIEPELVEDRVRRHPWVRQVRVTRIPTGTLSIELEERTPVLLVLDRNGEPCSYLDYDGYAMPLVEGFAYDLPLLRGYDMAPDRLEPVESRGLQELLLALQDVDELVNALMSDFEVRSGNDIWLYTTPLQGRNAVPVRLGYGEYAKKFEMLGAFWKESVLTQPDLRFTLIDLRFDGQIVTNEQAES